MFFKIVFKSIIFYSWLNLLTQLHALEFIEIASVDLREHPNLLVNQSQGRFYTRPDGAFIYEVPGGLAPWSIVVKPDKSHLIIIPLISKSVFTTNILSTTNINGIQNQTVEVTEINDTSDIDSRFVMATISNAGYLSVETKIKNRIVTIFKISATNKNIISSKAEGGPTGMAIKKYNSNGELQTEIYLEKTNNFTLVNGNSSWNHNNRFFVLAQHTDKNITFYRLTDSDLLSSPNRINLDSSQNGSLTATVNNPEQTLLNIQSSTNLIDWNTFKTIQNEPSLEIVVPANKQKEFIRAIE
jgi:hypothetical protein